MTTEGSSFSVDGIEKIPVRILPTGETGWMNAAETGKDIWEVEVSGAPQDDEIEHRLLPAKDVVEMRYADPGKEKGEVADDFDRIELCTWVDGDDAQSSYVDIERSPEAIEVFFAGGTEEPHLVKRLTGDETVQFHLQTKVLSMGAWDEDYQGETADDDPEQAYDWSLAVFRKDLYFICEGFATCPDEMQQLYALLEKNGVPRIWSFVKNGPFYNADATADVASGDIPAGEQ